MTLTRKIRETQMLSPILLLCTKAARAGRFFRNYKVFRFFYPTCTSGLILRMRFLRTSPGPNS